MVRWLAGENLNADIFRGLLRRSPISIPSRSRMPAVRHGRSIPVGMGGGAGPRADHA